MKTMDDHSQSCAHFADSMAPCTCGAEPDIVGCHYDENGVLRTNSPRVITRVMDDGIKTKDGAA